MNFKAIMLAGAGVILATGLAHSATTDPLFGTYQVRVVNFDANGQRPGDSTADIDNFNTQFDAATDSRRDTFIYRGELNFHIDNLDPVNGDAETIADFLDSGGDGSGLGTNGTGEVFGLDPIVGGLQLSKPTFNITTLFEFTGIFEESFETKVTHDDGFSLYQDTNLLLAFANPTGIRTTPGGNNPPVEFIGKEFKLVYAAANGNPSRLLVTGGVAAVPLPASALLLLGAFGLLGGLTMRRRTTA